MKDARAEVEALRREIPDELRRLRDLDFRTALSDQVTLSTFHGCPADEIEAMTVFLMEEMGLHVTVKLNPTLLGKEAVDGLLHDVLGYRDVETRAEDFERDLQWGQALEMTDRLAERARGPRAGAPPEALEHAGGAQPPLFFPPGEAVMYLSGPPLHVITLDLVERVRRARPEVPLSFSAGVDSRNFADCVALGLAPVTVCTDLLKPGGYGRLPKYLENLEERMRGLGVRTMRRLRGRRSGLDAAPAVARATADPRYRAEALRPPRRIGRHLALFDCINCDKCLPACPNDANFVYEAEPLAREYESYRVEGGRAVPVAGGRFEARERHQIANFQDFCNDCGNCDTFCPEDGGPYLEKPRFFGSLAAWREQGDARRLLRREAPGPGHDVGAPARRRVPPRGGSGRRPGRLHGRARHPRAAPPRARAGRCVRRSRHARGPHAGRGRLPDDGRPPRRRPRPAPRQPRERDGRRPVNLLLLTPDEVRDDGTALLTGRRHEHARAVLRVQAGETLRVGVRGGSAGRGRCCRRAPKDSSSG